MGKNSFFSYTYEQYNDIIKEQNRKLNPKEYQIFFLNNLKCFPHFPDVDLISELSYEKYERNDCNVNLIFLPFDSLYTKMKNNPLIFTYDNKEMNFEKEHIRLIRKVAESSDNEHALLLCRDKEDIYFFKGIIDRLQIDNIFSDYYFISITGYSNWSARCKNFGLFDFKNGNFCDFDKNDKNFAVQTQNVTDYLKNCSFGVNIKLIQDLLKTINDQKHGTSFVIFKNAEKARDETKRLCDAQRGFAAECPLEYSKFIDCIPQFTKVDGGFLLDSELTCYAYGCIYDGVVPKSFKGSLANGSRFNSTALYTYNLNSKFKSKICLGIVFSDDGGVKIAEIK